jgi:hypothetical protein
MQVAVKILIHKERMKFNFTLKPELILIILGVILVIALFYFNGRKEGFATQQGTVSGPTQSSATPADIPGATSSNPTTSVPQSMDIKDMQERLKNFMLLTEEVIPGETNLTPENLKKVTDLQKEGAKLHANLKLALANFDTSGFTLDTFKALRARLDEATNLLRMATVVAPKAKPTDVQKSLDLLKTFEDLVAQKRPENAALAGDQKTMIMELRDKIPDLQQRLLAALAQSDASTYTKGKLDILDKKLINATNELKVAGVVGGGAGTQVEQTVAVPRPSTDESYAALIAAEPQPTVVAGPVGVITVSQLKELVTRIGAEALRLNNLRSSAASIVSKIQQLEKLKADLGDIITKVEAKQMKLEDVPITPDAAAKFLAGFEKENSSLPPLIVPVGTTPTAVKAPTGIAEYEGIPAGEQAVQQLLSAAKDLRWSMEVRLEYDPHLKTREAMLGRVENIIKNLSTLAVSETPIPPQIHDQYLKEIKGMQRSFEENPPAYRGGDVGAMSRLPTGYARDPQGAPEPSAAEVNAAQGAGFGTQRETFPHGEIAPEVYTRPGFVMNDDQIAHRGSAASFIPAAGGADYKQRALDICRQVKSAQLGGPDNFGCITNPDEVGPNYDWKGNYTMVCNRLGDSWGRAYPQQFGCPPYDPTAKFASWF